MDRDLQQGGEGREQGGGLTVFGRFYARPGCEDQVAAALARVIPPTRAERACLGIEAFRDARDPSLFFIHSRWPDAAAFDRHAALPHTVRFLAEVRPLVDPPPDIRRAHRL